MQQTESPLRAGLAGVERGLRADEPSWVRWPPAIAKFGNFLWGLCVHENTTG